MNAQNRLTKRVLIVDDSCVMRAMLCEVFSEKAGFTIVGVAKNAKEAVALEEDMQPDIMAIDLMMPYIDGSQLLSMLDDRPSLMKIILSSKAVASEPLRARLLELGASAFFDKREIAADPDRFRQEVSGLLIARSLRRRAGAAAPVEEAAPPLARFPIPRDERDRIDLIDRLGLANTDPDHCLDIVGRHLAAQTAYPVAIVTLLAEERLWVKSAVGIERMSLPREETVCAHAICQDKPLVIANLAASPLTRHLAMVRTDPHFRSYAGAQIVSKTGVTVGMVCLLDMEPRQPTEAEIEKLVEAAMLARSFIEDVPAAVRQAA